MIIGMKRFSGKLSNNRYIRYPNNRHAHMHINFGYSIGGSTTSRHDSSTDQEAIQILTSTFNLKKNQRSSKMKNEKFNKIWQICLKQKQI